MTFDPEKCTPDDKRTLITFLADVRRQMSNHENRIDVGELRNKEMVNELANMEEAHRELLQDVKEIKATLNKYLPMWELAAHREKASRTLHQAIVEKSVVGMVWGAVVFVLFSTWHYVRYLLTQAG